MSAGLSTIQRHCGTASGAQDGHASTLTGVRIADTIVAPAALDATNGAASTNGAAPTNGASPANGAEASTSNTSLTPGKKEEQPRDKNAKALKHIITQIPSITHVSIIA